MFRLICIFLFFFIARQTYGSEHFSCGKSNVKISVIRVSHFAGDVNAVIEVQSGARKISRLYDAGWFIGGVCSEKKNSNPIVIFQAYCPGCDDAYGWGVIDTVTMRLLLAPDDTTINGKKAHQLKGNMLVPISKMMRISEENIDSEN